MVAENSCIAAACVPVKWWIPVFIGFSIWIWFASQGNDQHIQEIIALGTIPTTYLYLSSIVVILETKRHWVYIL